VKLLLENWRGYIKETEKAAIYGNLYLFEGDEISRTSFYDAISTLSESDDDADRFLENWERSIDHMLEGLNESIPVETGVGVIDDAVLKASTQAYMALNKLKGKAVGSVINVMKKLKGYGQKNPNVAKAIKVTVAGLAAATAAAGVYQLMQSGGDAGAVQELAQALSAVEPDVAKDVAEVAQNLTPESAVELVNSQEQTVSQVADTLAQSGDQGLQQVAQAAEQVENKYENTMSQWSDMFAQSDKNRAAGTDGESDMLNKWSDLFAQSDAERAARGDGWYDARAKAEEFMYKQVMGEKPDLQGLARAIEDGQFDGENRKFLKTLVKNMPQGEEKKQLRGFIRARDLGLGKSLSKLGKSLSE